MINSTRILLVEDNEGDILLTLEAFKQAKIANPVEVVKDGEEALRYLAKEGEYIDAQTPDLILLDINLPKVDGLEVLSFIKNDEKLRIIPVVMLTTSDAEIDILQSYQEHANCYITKPVNFNNFMEVIQTIKDFWINIVQLPKKQKI
ncbi:MAG: response regulator [Ginsengibacter sp.]